MREQGTIRKYYPDRRFGFIRQRGREDDLFFYGGQVSSENPQRITAGALVEFEIAASKKGPRAVAVELR